MSAIFGLYNRNSQPLSNALPERMSEALAHHGCDGGGIWMHGAVALGQRLMRFTPQDGYERQPRISADGMRVLVSDARLDNRDELIADGESLVADSRWQMAIRETRDAICDPRSAIPDGELILRAFEKWGEDCVHHLVGVFAFALWDARAQQLLMARSPITAPLLVYFASPQCFAFATMPSGLLALPFVPRALNEAKLADLLVQSPAAPADTLYRDIFRLRTGHLLTVGRAGIKVRRYWQPDLKRELTLARDKDYLAALNELLERVVRDHLASVTPVGVMLSGGLDSSSIAATAARLLASRGERLTAFTEAPRAGFDGPAPAGRYADETPLVRQIAAMYDNLDLWLIRSEGRTFLDDLDRLFFHLETPFRNTSNRVWMEAILQAARERGIRVVLDGMQGNLTISWNGSGLLPGLVRSGAWARALREANAMARRGAARSTFRALVGQGISPLLPQPLWLTLERLRGKAEARTAQPYRLWSAIHPDFAAAHRVEARARASGHDFRNRDTRGSRELRADALASQDFGAYLSAFRSMFGVDSRSPLADVRIAEFCLALPEEQFLYQGEPRALPRRAMLNRLPPQVLTNYKRGLQAADWFERSTQARAEIAAELEQLQACDAARRALDLDRMRQLVAQWPRDGWGERKTMQEYRILLEHGLMVGRFLRWFDTPLHFAGKAQ